MRRETNSDNIAAAVFAFSVSVSSAKPQILLFPVPVGHPATWTGNYWLVPERGSDVECAVVPGPSLSSSEVLCSHFLST